MPMRRPALLTIASLALAAAGARADDIGVSLFDGRTFTGWNGDTRTTWRIEEGTIVAGDPRSPAPRNEFLATDREYGDFELRLQWRIDCTTGCNAGIQFRSRRVPDHHEVSGFQADIGPGITGALYDETRRNRFLARPPRDVEARALAAARADGWNDYVIRCQGPRVRLVVNGVETLDYTEADPAIAARGVIALQIHGGLVGTIRYRDIRLVELAEAPPPAAARPARLERLPDRVRATIGGAAFTDWIFGGGGRAKPVLFPLVGPHGLALTRSWPVGPRLPGEPADHPHHESFWFAHGDVNGHDFWTGKRGARIEQMTLESMADGVIVAACRWLAPDGTVVCTDRRTIGLAAEGNDRVVDHAIEITAGADPVVFGDTKEGTLAVRVRPELNVRAAAGGPPATGHYLNAAGDRDGAVWGRPAAWVDLSGTVEGRRVGIACLDHPANPRHPTTWHARDYGLFAANPFGLHDFRGAPAGSGRLELRPGERLTLRHRWILHEGDAAEARIAERFAAWAGTPAPAAAGSAPVSAPPPP